MSKILIIDTNVFLYEPNCLETFQENDIIIPGIVLSELDKRKNIDRNARQSIRKIEEYRLKGDLNTGVLNENGGTIKVEFYKNNLNFPKEFDLNEPDNLILGISFQVKRNNPDSIVELVTKDINLRIKAESLKIEDVNNNIITIVSNDYIHYKKNYTENSIENTLIVNDNIINILFEENSYSFLNYNDSNIDTTQLLYNYYILKSNIDLNKSALVRYVKEQNRFILIRNDFKKNNFGISPLNAEQIFLADGINNDNVDLIFSIGPAGTGKTLISLNYSLCKVLDGRYKKLIIFRNAIPFGKDLGFLPGNIDEKIDPWMKPIYDNLELILNNIEKDENAKSKLFHKKTISLTSDYIKQSGLIEFSSTIHIRGRTFNDCIVIVDEAQNMTPHEIKTIITRIGKNCKMIFTGDPNQIDVPYLSSNDNGLVYASSKFQQQNIDFVLVVNLFKTERSRVVEKAIEIL